jgi:hypothetical protein
MSQFEYCKLLTPKDNEFFTPLPKYKGYHFKFTTKRKPNQELVCVQFMPLHHLLQDKKNASMKQRSSSTMRKSSARRRRSLRHSRKKRSLH